jgi:hypothetical protein
MAIYTSGRDGRVYHIVLERGRSYTLCGLKVVASKSLLTEPPEDGELCKHCERLQKQTSNSRQG